MAGIARRILRYTTRLGAAALYKKPSQPEKKAISNKNAISLLPSPSIANNTITPIRPSTSPPITLYKAEPITRDPTTTSNTTSTTIPGLPL
jgi:hypothetical protein